MTDQKKVLIATYTVDECFKIPIGLDLENKDQVKCWTVKYTRLYIRLADDTHLEIESQGWLQEYDFKYPSNDETRICDANEYPWFEDEDWEYFDCQTGETTTK